MTELYTSIEPYDHGLLDIGDGNLMYWETCGNRDGKPAVMVHGGPAADPASGVTVAAVARQWGWASPSQFSAAYRRQFDLPPSQTLRS